MQATMLTDGQVQQAVWEAWNRQGWCNTMDAATKHLACEIGGFEPCDLQAWIDAHSSEEIGDLLM